MRRPEKPDLASLNSELSNVGSPRLIGIMTFDRGMIASAGLSVAGLVLLGNLTYHYLKHGLQLETISHPAILGLLLIILGFQTFGFALLMEVAKRVISRSQQ